MNNDDKILELKRKIEIERANLKQISQYSPRTTCIIKLNDNPKYNLRTMSVNELNQLLLIVQSLICVAMPMKLMDTEFFGFTLEDWKADIIGFRDQKTISDRKALISKYESKLQSMLSDDKKIELEIEEIEKTLDI